MPDIKWLIGILLILVFIWLISGGPGSEQSKRPFVTPPAPLGPGEDFGPEFPSVQGGGNRSEEAPPVENEEQPLQEEEVEQQEAEEEIDESPKPTPIFKEGVSFGGRGRATATNPDDEYLEIIASSKNTQPIHISNWKLKSAVTGREVSLGKGTYLPFRGQINIEDSLFLRPGERAFIVTGRSPIGVSFRLNTCTGYFAQFQDFTPRLPTQCPLPRDEDFETGPAGLNDACIDYIETLPRCTAHIQSLPLEFSNNPICQEYITTKITYNGCVELHKDDTDFYKAEWRIFLKRDQELWKEKRETILLLDEDERVIDSISY